VFDEDGKDGKGGKDPEWNREAGKASLPDFPVLPVHGWEGRPMTEQLTGSQILCRALLDQGVDVLFGYPGGAIMPFYHALPEYPGLRHVLVRHEQAAAHAADGYARASGRAGVCVATSGPGATNLVTGLATANMDNTPVVAITGQVARAMMGRDAFQETDIIGITQPITKHNRLVEDVEELEDAVAEAFYVAQEGRPGPVLIDIPKDVQNQKAEWKGGQADRWTGGKASSTAVPPYRRTALIEDAARLIAEAQRPLIMAGHGVLLSNAYAELRALSERTGIPVITTLLGISGFPESHPLHLGMPGMHGEVHVNRAIQQADLIIGLGLRFDDRVTGNLAGFARGAKVIHVDLDPSEIGKNVPVEIGLVGDVRAVLCSLLDMLAPRHCDAWREEIESFVRPRQEAFRGGLTPETILDAIDDATLGRCSIVSDVGQHQMWVAKLFRYQRPNSHITSGGLGTMGFAVPAAMGVALARPDEPVWAISGDGGFQMNMQEMATMVQEGIPVKMAIFNNGYLGMVRQWQQFFHGKRYSATPIWSPDYVRLAEAYGIAGWRVESADQAASVVREATAEPGPALVEFVIEQEANVYPMIPPGGSLSEPIEGEPAPPLVPA
jgi:acetolactate synthase-1/2/3 large subunit